jgi:hypothetical protein
VPAPSNDNSDLWVRDELLHLLSVSGTLAGLCVTVVALMHTLGKINMTRTVIDDLFALCGLMFLTCTYLIFTALRTKKGRVAGVLIQVVDTVFLVGLTVMTAAGFMMVYTVW